MVAANRPLIPLAMVQFIDLSQVGVIYSDFCHAYNVSGPVIYRVY